MSRIDGCTLPLALSAHVVSGVGILTDGRLSQVPSSRVVGSALAFLHCRIDNLVTTPIILSEECNFIPRFPNRGCKFVKTENLV